MNSEIIFSKEYQNFLFKQWGSRELKGEDIKQIRKAYNLSQRSFSELLGINIKTLQNYEIDRYRIPSTATSLFLFAKENMSLIKTKYLKNVQNIWPFRS